MTMQEYEQLVPDAEMFARVWKRVMPDEKSSCIVVHQPKEKGGRRPPVPPKEVPPEPRCREDRAWLREAMEEMEAGIFRAGEILRRDPGAWPLGESMGRSAAQLKAAWLLLTGERWKNSGRGRGGTGGMENRLREQYLWELRFSELCRRAGENLTRGDMAEIMPEQERESGRRRRMLRHMLAGRG